MSRPHRRPLSCFVSVLFLAAGLLIGGWSTPAFAAEETAQAARSANAAIQPQWGIAPGTNYVCCYPGKGEDILFLHGVDGSGAGADGNDPNGNCQNNFGVAANMLSDAGHQWVGNLIMLQYYNHDHCTIDYSKTPNMNFADIHQSADAGHCTTYYDGNDGTNNEDDHHLACVLAWWIWDNYTTHNWKVNVVAHSLGGDLVKEALYQIHVNHDSHFPNHLSLDHVVTLDSPLTGVVSGGGLSCGGCLEVEQIEWGSFGGIYQDITSDAGKAVGQAQGINWIMEGDAAAFCGGLPGGGGAVGDSAFGMSYGIKVDYRFGVPGISGLTAYGACSPNNNGTYYYGHGTYQQDNQTANNVKVAYCNGCSGDPPISTPISNWYHSLSEMFWGIAGNCSTTSSISTCDGDDAGVTGCSATKTIPGGDPSYLTVYWTNACSTNWALVSAPSGDLLTVTIARSPTKSWSNVDRHLIYCAPSWTSCPTDTWAKFGPATTSWITDMLYAPNESVAVRITTTTGATYTSIWH